MFGAERVDVDESPAPDPEPEHVPEPPRIEVDSAETIALSLSERIARGRAPTEPAG